MLWAYDNTALPILGVIWQISYWFGIKSRTQVSFLFIIFQRWTLRTIFWSSRNLLLRRWLYVQVHMWYLWYQLLFSFLYFRELICFLAFLVLYHFSLKFSIFHLFQDEIHNVFWQLFWQMGHRVLHSTHEFWMVFFFQLCLSLMFLYYPILLLNLLSRRLTPATITAFIFLNTFMTFPIFPLSLPDLTLTVSPLTICHFLKVTGSARLGLTFILTKE